jgi:phosphoribosylglycinamide formyltransferase-1
LDKSFNYIISPEISEFRRFSPKLKIGVLASGKGTNFQELINLSEKGELDIDIKVLITNKNDAGCIKRAESVNIPHKIIRDRDFQQKEQFELEIANTLIHYDVELVVMAGWMKIMSPFFINRQK